MARQLGQSNSGEVIGSTMGGRSLGSLPQAQAIPQPTRGFRGFAEGIAKGELSTIRGIGTIGQKVLDATINKIPGVNAGSDIYRPKTQTGIRTGELLKPQGTAQNIGFGLEQLAEFFIPASKAAKAEQALTTITQGLSSPALAATGRILGKGLVQGLAAGVVSLAQTGGDIKESAKVATTAGVARSAFATIGEGARALKIPERLYSTIFKNSKNDMIAELRANGIANLARTNPIRYQELVDSGIIRVGAGGSPIINETLAEKALDRGLRGSIRNMANHVVGGALNSEAEVQRIAKTYSGTISMKEKQYVNVFKQIASSYEDVGFGEISKEASYLASIIDNSNGKVPAEIAVQARRFLDKMRIASSYDRPATSLSLTQSNFKTLADSLRGRINAIPGMSPVMKDYSFYIDAMEALAREASRRGNNQVISLIDSIFLGGGLSSSSPAPLLTIGVLRKMLLSGQGMTALGQLINKGNASPATSGVIGGASRGVQSLLGDQ